MVKKNNKKPWADVRMGCRHPKKMVKKNNKKPWADVRAGVCTPSLHQFRLFITDFQRSFETSGGVLVLHQGGTSPPDVRVAFFCQNATAISAPPSWFVGTASYLS